MKTTAEYLELALKFEMSATFEENHELKADFENSQRLTESWRQPEWKVKIPSRPKSPIECKRQGCPYAPKPVQ